MTEIFGRWTPTGRSEKRGESSYLECVCTCGSTQYVAKTNLTRGRSKSCGCLRKELVGPRSETHGKSGSRAYHTWKGMIARVLNHAEPAYVNYGGRGITVSDSWLKFENFYADMGDPQDGMSLDRKDNDLGYCKDNCRWATRKEQSNNRRNNVRLTVEGREYRLQEIADLHGIGYATVKHRRRSGWTPEQLVRGYR